MLILYCSSSTTVGPTGNLNTWTKNYHIEMDQLFSFVIIIPRLRSLEEFLNHILSDVPHSVDTARIQNIDSHQGKAGQ